MQGLKIGKHRPLFSKKNWGIGAYFCSNSKTRDYQESIFLAKYFMIESFLGLTYQIHTPKNSLNNEILYLFIVGY